MNAEYTGKKIAELRKEKKITQEQLAEKIGVKKQNISRYESGRVEPNIRTAKKLADALGVSLEDMEAGVSSFSASAPALSPDEAQLVEDYRSLNKEGREYIRQTMAMAKRSYVREAHPVSDMEAAK